MNPNAGDWRCIGFEPENTVVMTKIVVRLRGEGCGSSAEAEMKPSIDEQIEAVALMSEHCLVSDVFRAETMHALDAALSTLRWVKLKTKPALGSVMEAFPGAKVVSQEDE
jgi:hypothetical protein